MFRTIFLSILLIVEIHSNPEKKDLFDETQFKYLKLRNRVFRAPVIDCESWVNGKLTDKFYRRYEELSKNEVGTIITGQMLISDDKEYENMVRIDKDEYIEDFKKLTDLVHKNGANIIAQLGPFGKPDISKSKIHELENLFVDAVVRAQKAGFDGIEICANHHVLLSQFLSPLFNHREDEYGGNDENRARFVIEIIEKIREKVGKDYIIILKINSEDDDPNGITPDGFLTACKLAEKAGVDMIDVTGMKWKKIKESKVVYFDIGKTLADTLKIPILVTGGVKDLNVANEALNKSNIQYIGLSRALLSEPDILVKWKNCENKKSQCVRCMKCYDFDFNEEVQCIINKNKNKNKKNIKLEFKDNKWKLNLSAVLFDDIKLNDKSGEIFKITNKTQGLKINRDIEIETEYAPFYASKDFFDYIEDNNYFFNEKEKLCERKIVEGNIIYLCDKNKKDKIKNINLVLNNKYVLQLTKEHLLTCKENSDICEFNIKYNPKVNKFVLGAEILKSLNINIMKNENNAHLKYKDMLECDLTEAQLNIIGKKNKMKALFQLMNTFTVVVSIFFFLFLVFCLHEKFRGHLYEEKDKKDEEELVDIEDKEKN